MSTLPANTPTYIPADQVGSQPASSPRKSEDAINHSSENGHHFQRTHRAPGELELGITGVLEGRSNQVRHVANSEGLSNWSGRRVWESHRPEWLVAFVAEFFGTFLYCVAGEMSTAAFIVTTYAGEPQGSLLTIGFAYGLGIALAITCCASGSGGHFNTCVTIVQWLFRGFPLKKVPLYITAQLCGAFAASLVVLASWKSELLGITAKLIAEGKEEVVYSAAGPAGVIALFPTAGRSYASIFANEFFGDLILALAIWSNIDGTNPFTAATVAPYNIGFAFTFVVWGFAPGDVATNTARDLGARFACATLWDADKCFPPRYTLLTTFTNILAALVGVSIYTFILSDTRRPPASVAAQHHEAEIRRAMEEAEEHHAELLDRKISKVISRGGDASHLERRRTTISSSKQY